VLASSRIEKTPCLSKQGFSEPNRKRPALTTNRDPEAAAMVDVALHDFERRLAAETRL
jgi:hypothetical protein